MVLYAAVRPSNTMRTSHKAPFAVSATPSRARGRWLRAPVRRTTAALASPTNGPDEVASVTSRVHIAKSPQLFEYDLDGNQTLVATKTGTWRVTYNGENRPVLWERVATDSNTLTSNTQTRVSMSFDHQGRRRMYLEAAADGSTNRLDRFTYDNYLCIARNRWQPDGTSAADRFIWDPTEPVATRPLIFYQPNAPPQLYSIDGNKNISELVSSDSGTISAHYEYAPFGEVILSPGDLAFTNPFRFSSEYVDDLLDLVYYNFRHLEPISGRWLHRDALSEFGGFNLYCILFNSSINRSDHLGFVDDSCLTPGSQADIEIVITARRRGHPNGSDPKAIKAANELLDALKKLGYVSGASGVATGRTIIGAISAAIDFLSSREMAPGTDDFKNAFENLLSPIDSAIRKEPLTLVGYVQYKICDCVDGKLKFVPLRYPATENFEKDLSANANPLLHGETSTYIGELSEFKQRLFVNYYDDYQKRAARAREFPVQHREVLP